MHSWYKLYCCVEPKMKDLHNFVIPRVATVWKKLADYLEVDLEIIRDIERENGNDPNKCCTELFRKWLNNEIGPEPKLWYNLITTLKEIKELTIEEIELSLKCT